jgi:FtsP/CotA-like multicopper oxidase with cupredoxin domain
MLTACCASALLACSAPTHDPDVAPDAPADPLSVPEAKDQNPDPHVFETTLDARVEDLEILPGTTTPVWTYDGVLPGPLIRVVEGDRLIVHFTNHLPEATTIHWHGLRISNDMDGVPEMTQPEVEPGGAFTYDFVVPDAGTYWYHPHVDAAAQAGFGLYGPIVVTDPAEPQGLGKERVLVLSDMTLGEDGTPVDPESVQGGGELAALFGREGSPILVNGQVNPVLTARSGERLRFRLINSARSRYFNFGIDGQTLTRIGSDDGLLARPETLGSVLVASAQRADIVLDLAQPPSTEQVVSWVAYDRGFGSHEFRKPEKLFTIRTTDEAPVTPPPLPALARDIQPLDVSAATSQSMNLTENNEGNAIVLGINGVPGSRAEPLLAMLGETQVWTLQNTIDWDHPFHLHGFFFQVLDVNGVAPSVLEWRDTVNVPVEGTVRIAVRFDERPGMWMFHCHILDHADLGMMGMVHLHASP